jgi:HSP20 family protein
MRYRRLSYRYTMVVRPGQTLPLGDIWQSDRLRLLVQPRWRPDADTYETATTVEIMVDLAGVEDDDLEVQLFEDVLVVEGRRRLPSCQEGAVYHAAGIRRARSGWSWRCRLLWTPSGGRGRDPRPSADVHRCTTRPHHPGAPASGDT